jgi:hypothetical protein
LGEKVLALVVNGAICPPEATLLLAETMGASLATQPAPPVEG